MSLKVGPKCLLWSSLGRSIVFRTTITKGDPSNLFFFYHFTGFTPRVLQHTAVFILSFFWGKGGREV
jgi:hypothetical protein